MNVELPYRDGNALWAAVTARAKAESKTTGVTPGSLVRRFVVDRFLARVFFHPENGWVLKGGNAVLTRVHDARTTKDIDLLAELGDLDAALESLRGAIAIDLNDHFRFVISTVRDAGGGDTQPNLDGYKVLVEAYCGVRRRDSFSVELVTGSVMTAEPDSQSRATLVPAILPTTVRLYPAVDHVADKLCATQSTYGTNGDQPSSRVRDLVDLVVFARTQQFDGARLTKAISSEWTHRGLTGHPCFDPPQQWKRNYAAEASRVPACGDTLAFDSAVTLVSTFLSPALEGTAHGRHWAPEQREWVSFAPSD